MLEVSSKKLKYFAEKSGNIFRQFIKYEKKEVNIYNLKEKMYFFKNAFAPAIARCIMFLGCPSVCLYHPHEHNISGT